MPNYLNVLAVDAIKSIEEGYYETSKNTPSSLSLKKSILTSNKIPIIGEIKFASPSLGKIRDKANLGIIAKEMEEGGVVGISVLTEPKHFKGNIKFIEEIRDQVNIPILMKDIILDPIQIQAAFKVGANAILLIQKLFEMGYCEKPIQYMIKYAQTRNLEVLLEVHTEKEFISALKTNADFIGINNRNLETFNVNIDLTKNILINNSPVKKIIVSESGINNKNEINFLRKYGVQAFLVGTTIMKSNNIKNKVKELVETG